MREPTAPFRGVITHPWALTHGGNRVMLDIVIIPESPVADIFASKCCGGLPDQNLEVRITNHGPSPVAVQSRLVLEGDGPPLTWEAVCPLGGIRLAPGDVAALYASLDPDRLRRYQTLVLYEADGRAHRAPIPGGRT
jgi:hypothetical protein